MKLFEARAVVEAALSENTERTLYHGTWKGYAPSIKEVGLVPDVGDFVNDMYGPELGEIERFSMSGEEDARSLLFFGDKRTMSSCVGAMRWHISRKVPGFRQLSDVTLKDVEKHGALVIVKEADVPKPKDDYDAKEDGFHLRPRDDADANFYAEYPMSVEPGDYYYYGDRGLATDAILTGKKMMRFLRRHGALRDFMEEKRQRLIAAFKKGVGTGKAMSTGDAARAVKAMSDDEVLRAGRRW